MAEDNGKVRSQLGHVMSVRSHDRGGVERFDALELLHEEDFALFYETVADRITKIFEEYPSALDEVRAYFSGASGCPSANASQVLKHVGLMNSDGEFVSCFHDIWQDYEAQAGGRFVAIRDDEDGKRGAGVLLANDNDRSSEPV